MSYSYNKSAYTTSVAAKSNAQVMDVNACKTEAVTNARQEFTITLPVIAGSPTNDETAATSKQWLSYTETTSGNIKVTPSYVYDNFYGSPVGDHFPVNNYIIPFNPMSVCPYMLPVGNFVKSFSYWNIDGPVDISLTMEECYNASTIFIKAMADPPTGAVTDLVSLPVGEKITMDNAKRTSRIYLKKLSDRKFLDNPLNILTSAKTGQKTQQWNSNEGAGVIQVAIHTPTGENQPAAGQNIGTLTLTFTVIGSSYTVTESDIKNYNTFINQQMGLDDNKDCSYSAGGKDAVLDAVKEVRLVSVPPEGPVTFPHIRVDKTHVIALPKNYRDFPPRYQHQIRTILHSSARRGVIPRNLAAVADPTGDSFLAGYNQSNFPAHATGSVRGSVVLKADIINGLNHDATVKDYVTLCSGGDSDYEVCVPSSEGELVVVDSNRVGKSLTLVDRDPVKVKCVYGYEEFSEQKSGRKLSWAQVINGNRHNGTEGKLAAAQPVMTSFVIQTLMGKSGAESVTQGHTTITGRSEAVNGAESKTMATVPYSANPTITYTTFYEGSAADTYEAPVTYTETEAHPCSHMPGIVQNVTNGSVVDGFTFKALASCIKRAGEVAGAFFGNTTNDKAGKVFRYQPPLNENTVITNVGQEILEYMKDWPRADVIAQDRITKQRNIDFMYGLCTPGLLKYAIAKSSADIAASQKISLTYDGVLEVKLPLLIHSSLQGSQIGKPIGTEVSEQVLFIDKSGKKVKLGEFVKDIELSASVTIVASRFAVDITDEGSLEKMLSNCVVCNSPDDGHNSSKLAGNALSLGTTSSGGNAIIGSSFKFNHGSDAYDNNMALYNLAGSLQYSDNAQFCIPKQLPNANGVLEEVKQGDVIYFYAITNVGVAFPTTVYEIPDDEAGRLMVSIFNGVPAGFHDFGIEGVDEYASTGYPAFAFVGTHSSYTCADCNFSG